MSRRTEDLRAEMCGYREYDGGPPEFRVDLVDLATVSTVASLTPDRADELAEALRREADRARARTRHQAAPQG